MFMVNFYDFFLNFCFLGIIICLPMFSVVVISIWTDMQPLKKPAHTKFIGMFVYKSISLYSISLAKNAAAFFRKRFSFFCSSSSFLSRRISCNISNSVKVFGSDWACFWHSLVNSSHHFETLDLAIPNSVVSLLMLRPSSI